MEKDEKYTQLCLWPGTVVGEDQIEEFVKSMKENFGVRVKYECEVKTLPDIKDGKAVPETGDRNDLFFYVHSDDISKFAVPRLQYGIRWWEDVIKYNDGNRHLYTDEFLEKYEPTW